jgi:hypothetical protein
MSLPPVHRQSMDEAVAEAEAKGLEYDPTVRATYIRSMLRDIALWIAQNETEDEIRKKVPTFIELYPELFKKIIQRQDLSPIQSMLQALDKMAEGNLSQHQASVLVGKKLVDKYVTPQLNSKNSKSV